MGVNISSVHNAQDTKKIKVVLAGVDSDPKSIKKLKNTKKVRFDLGKKEKIKITDPVDPKS